MNKNFREQKMAKTLNLRENDLGGYRELKIMELLVRFRRKMFQNSLCSRYRPSKEIVYPVLRYMPFSSIFIIDGVASVAAVAMARLLK
ncbi:hypothetical protein CEXT_329821 [Caerostris extrusa]|uniref:Uncharacterized protein n=1 Tax=Caerostris extrusa TaxID=172846 RepID=A0AAV4MPM9_CAEEX|nr:hypothetical protein CEXT_329821 [Caerostris extrusa]